MGKVVECFFVPEILTLYKKGFKNLETIFYTDICCMFVIWIRIEIWDFLSFSISVWLELIFKLIVTGPSLHFPTQFLTAALKFDGKASDLPQQRSKTKNKYGILEISNYVHNISKKKARLFRILSHARRRDFSNDERRKALSPGVTSFCTNSTRSCNLSCTICNKTGHFVETSYETTLEGQTDF